MNELMNYRIVLVDYSYMLMMLVVMMMYNQDCVDQMDVDVEHLQMVVGNKVVENPIHLDLPIDRNYWIHWLY